jgi:hypothetical protein
MSLVLLGSKKSASLYRFAVLDPKNLSLDFCSNIQD